MKQVLWGLMLLLALPAAGDDAKQAINTTLDAFHIAASEADYPAYTALITEQVVFLGTDATERWQGEAFREFVRGYLDKGRGWIYVPMQRSVDVSPDGGLAWFDEPLEHEHLGTCRGSGLLVLGEVADASPNTTSVCLPRMIW